MLIREKREREASLVIVEICVEMEFLQCQYQYSQQQDHHEMSLYGMQ